MSGMLYGKIARQAAEHYAHTGEYLSLNWPLPPEMLRQKACYVSITEEPGRHVRAVAGSTLPRQKTLAEEIIHNTVDGIVANDVRVRQVDMASYAYTVAVLGFMERITDKVHLQPLLYGLYVRTDMNKSAVLLPRRVGIETADDQIATAIREAHIDPRNEIITMYRFPVIFYGS